MIKHILTSILCLSTLISFSQEKIKVVSSASIFQDMAKNIGGDKITSMSIVPIGRDPHTYTPKPSDVELVSSADLILINGLTFEGWITELIENSGTKAKIILISEGVEPIISQKYHNASDPHAWMDSDMLLWDDEEAASPSDLLGFSWRSDPQTWEEKKWVKVDSVVDSGAFAPVAPPTMLPNVKVEPSPGSIRGQKYTSASKHKLKNLGQQKIQACTEQGDETEVLFQIADVSKPLVSVSSICERGNRVLFGKSGGVVINMKTGKEIPFYRRNNIYVLSLALALCFY